MVNIDTWTSGYKVRAFDWIDSKNIYINIAYYKPGSSLSRQPEREKSFLIPKKYEDKLRNFLDSVVCGLMESNIMAENNDMEVLTI